MMTHIDNLGIHIDELELSVRSYNCLRRNGIRFVGDLVKLNEVELIRWEFFGRKSLAEVNLVLAQLGLYLGMETPSSLQDEKELINAGWGAW